MKNRGSLKLHKDFDALYTSLNVNVQKNAFNVNVNKKLPKGFSVNANLNKVSNKSSTSVLVKKDLGKGFSIGVTKTKDQKPYYSLSFKKKLKYGRK